MIVMNGTAYKLLGFLVWRGGKWYLRRRLPSARMLAAAAGTGVVAMVAAVLIARRIVG
jgi:hypothetical protein